MWEGKSDCQSGNMKVHTQTAHQGKRNWKCDQKKGRIGQTLSTVQFGTRVSQTQEFKSAQKEKPGASITGIFVYDN